MNRAAFLLLPSRREKSQGYGKSTLGDMSHAVSYKAREGPVRWIG